MEVSIEEIKQMQKRREEINSYSFDDIVFTINNEPININDKILKDWIRTGFNNVTFIETDFYLTGFKEEI